VTAHFFLLKLRFDRIGSKAVSPLADNQLNKVSEASYKAHLFDPVLGHLESTWVLASNVEQTMTFVP